MNTVTHAINFARHQSIKNEPDFLQEDIMGNNEMNAPESPGLTPKQCFKLLDKVCPDSPLPTECNQFEEVKVMMQRKNSNRDSHAVAFQGMSAGEAASAMAAREKGKLNHAQIQRRLTTSKKRTLW